MTPKMPENNEITVMSGEELGHRDTGRLVLDYLQRLIMHHGLWFAEVKHQFGQQVAMELLSIVSEKTLQAQLSHIGKVFGFNLAGGLPEPLLAMEPDDLHKLRQSLAKCWLANDGIWFQAVENRFSMNDAKRCNDSCWAQFSPVEANSIKTFLGLGKQPGLDGLQQALGFRLYEGINQQSVQRESDSAVVFRMTNCRVQSARNRKNLPDYPCKSAGLVEYSRFAAAIDDRIVTECIGCPPDPHPAEWYCAWRFVLPANKA
jgi:hypothetical protein